MPNSVSGTDLQGGSAIPGNTPINITPPAAAPAAPVAAPKPPAPAAPPAPTPPAPVVVNTTQDTIFNPKTGNMDANPNYIKQTGDAYGTSSALPKNAQTDPNNPSGATYYRVPAATPPAGGDSALNSARAYQEQPVKTQTEAEIRADELAQQQARIDSIMKAGQAAADREYNLGNDTARSYRGLLGMTGNIGSATAASTVRKTANDTQANVDIEAQKTQQLINAVYDKVDTAVTDKLNAQKTDNKANAQAIIDKSVKSGQDALAAYGATLGVKGTDYATAKTTDPAEFGRLKDLTGYTDLQMEQAFNNGIPEQYRPVISDSVGIGANGNAVIHHATFNPVTGTATAPVIYDTGVPYNQYKGAETVKGGDGTQFMPNPADGGKTYVRITPQTADEQAKANLDNANAAAAKNNAANGTTSAHLGNSILTSDYVKNLFTADQLKTAANTAGLTTSGFLGVGKSPDTDAYLKSVMSTIKAYQDAGYTDKQILDQMKG